MSILKDILIKLDFKSYIYEESESKELCKKKY